MSKRKEKLLEFEPPKKKLLTDHEERVKQLYMKQTNVETTLKNELSKEQSFESHIEASSSITSGTASLQQLQNNEAYQTKINTLLNYGLSIKDVEIYEDYQQNGLKYIQKKNIHHEPELLQKRIENISRVLSNKQKEENDYQNITFQNELKTAKIYPHEHPMNDIKILESDFSKSLEDSPNLVNIKHIRRKARKEANKLTRETAHYNVTTSVATNVDQTISGNTKWDKMVLSDPVQPHTVITKKKVAYTCQNQNFYTIKDGKIVKIEEDECIHTSNNEKLVISGQLTMGEIKDLPQFKNYDIGEPSNMIYVKNLPKKITTENLKVIFKDCPVDEYKLMNGKMRGQAFLTCNSIESAEKVLSSLNGVIVNDKPIILQFGRRHKEN